jgi:toxin ParE1/3/4
MLVRWTEPAVQDLESIARYIKRDNPTAALRVTRALYDRAMSLETFPNLGRAGRIAGTREITMAPYVIVYRIAQAVEILHIHHGAQNWP